MEIERLKRKFENQIGDAVKIRDRLRGPEVSGSQQFFLAGS